MKAEDIAASLSEAQRRALIRGRVPYGRGYWPLYNALLAKGLVSHLFGHPPTDLGLAVRSHLLKERGE